jgi:hypothetical protein
VPIAAALTVAPDDLVASRQLAGARQAPAVLVQRAKILLLTAEGVSNTGTASVWVPETRSWCWAGSSPEDHRAVMIGA